MSQKRPREETLNTYKKQKPTTASSNRLCSHCGEDLPETEDQYHPACRHEEDVCKSIAKEFVTFYSSTPHVLYIGLHVHYIYGLSDTKKLTKPEKEERKKDITKKKQSKIEELTRKVSALRNSVGGYLLIQLVGLSPEDTYTGALDEFMAVPLNRLIEDGNLFCNVYTKTHIREFENFKDKPECSNMVMLHVAASTFITTLENNSKVALDDRIETPTPHTMISWVRRMKEKNEQKEGDGKNNREEIQIVEVNASPKDLQESRNIQFKSFNYEKNPKMTHEELIEDIFESARLPEYVSAFSKNEKGGHFLFGVREEDREFKELKYLSKRTQPHGLECKDTFIKDIERTLADRILVCNPNGKTQDQRIFEVHMNDTLKDDYKPNRYLGPVLQVSVQPVAGVVFSNKAGPLAYRVKKDVCRCTVEEWFKAIHRASNSSLSQV